MSSVRCAHKGRRKGNECITFQDICYVADFGVYSRLGLGGARSPGRFLENGVVNWFMTGAKDS